MLWEERTSLYFPTQRDYPWIPSGWEIHGRAPGSSKNPLNSVLNWNYRERMTAFIIFSKWRVVPPKVKIWWFSQWFGEQKGHACCGAGLVYDGVMSVFHSGFQQQCPSNTNIYFWGLDQELRLMKLKVVSRNDLRRVRMLGHWPLTKVE